MKTEEALGDRLKKDEPLKNHTTYRLGGPADFYFSAKSPEDATMAIKAAKEDGLRVFVLGGGSNILVSDAGFRGLVISYAARQVNVEGTRLIADAGAILYTAVHSAVEAGLTGLEWAAGIPGTVGGAVCGNSGAYGGETKDRLEAVQALDMKTGEECTFSREDCRFAYRDSIFKKGSWLITRAAFALEPGNRDSLSAKAKEIIERRKSKLPVEHANSGSVFRSFFFRAPAEIPAGMRDGLPAEFLDYGRIPAAWIFDKLGLKGKRIGGAEISEKHANFFVNKGKASSEDVRELIAYAKMKAKEHFGVELKEEILYIGF